MIIALKGYIGSGKSTLSNILKDEHKFKVINADEIVHDLYEDVNIQNEVCSLLGINEFSRKEIGKIVFEDHELLKKLENFIHPKLEDKMNEFIDKYKDNIILDCQVIDKLNIDYNYEILVLASKEDIIKRVSKRDNKTEAQINNILKAQEEFVIQTKKIFPINTSGEMDDIRYDLEKVLKIFTKDLENKSRYEDEEDEDEYYW